MKKKTVLSLIAFLISAGVSAQIKFEKGYFIDNGNRKIECLIKNEDWKSNPSLFFYRMEENGTIFKATKFEIKEFTIYQTCKYITADVEIDRTGYDLQKLSEEKDPTWSSERLFLKVLIEGKASLYYFEEGYLKRYFYNTVESPEIKQLIYRKYLSEKHELAINEWYKQQLLLDVRCGESSIGDLGYTGYNQKDLMKYFRTFNNCNGSEVTIYNKANTGRDFLGIKITPGINLSALTMTPGSPDAQRVNINNDISFRIGTEIEYILPFNKNKWGILFEPSFHYFKAERQYGNNFASADLKSIEFPVGLRNYMFLNNHSRIFLNILVIPNFTIKFNSKLSYIYTDHIHVKPSLCFALGGGYEFKQFSAELRYYTNKEMCEIASLPIRYNRFSLVLGYKIVHIKHNK
jgi:hypothetical protein